MFSRIYVEITNICNMNCSFCHGHSRKLKQMTTEEFKEILDKISGFTNYIYYHLMGEPLTHPELPEFIKTASNKGFKSMITTNGTLLKQYGDKILDAGIHKVNISVHSFEDGTEEQFEDYKTLELNRIKHSQDILESERNQFEKYKEVNMKKIELENKNLEQKCDKFRELFSQFNSNFKPIMEEE